jgi:ribonuclease Z
VTAGPTNIRLVGLGIVFAIAVASWGLTCAAWRFDRVAAGVVPLDPREFARMTVVVIGSGGPHPDPNRRGPAVALAAGKDVLLVDAGRGVAEGLRSAKLPVTQPGIVLLSSLLPENAVGLDDLLAARWQAGETTPLRVYGPPGTAALARELESALREPGRSLWGALGIAGEPPGLEAHEVEDGFTLAQGNLSLRAGALPGGPVPALAWHAEWRGRSALVSRVGFAPDALAREARGAQLWLHEAVMLPTPEQVKEFGVEADPERLRHEAALWTAVAQSGVLAQRAGTETLVLVRLWPPPVYALQITSQVDDAFAGRIVVADDGDEITP